MTEPRSDDDTVEMPVVPAWRADPSLIEATPGMARLTANTWWRVATRVVDISTRTGVNAVKAALRGESPAKIAQDTAEELGALLQRTLGDSDDSHDVNGMEPRRATEQELRAKGEALLYRSADVRFEEDMHPAYERILDQIAPDEARILRLLALRGAQPTIDVRTNRPFGVGSELVAERLSMIGEEAGCRHLDRTHAYLNNLFRLGLVWFSKEKVEPSRYQVVEVQPVVVEAMKRAGRSPRTVYRSIHLTPFGEDFCGICLPLDEPGRTTNT